MRKILLALLATLIMSTTINAEGVRPSQDNRTLRFNLAINGKLALNHAEFSVPLVERGNISYIVQQAKAKGMLVLTKRVTVGGIEFVRITVAR